MIFINPKIDYAFKKNFGSSESKDILISFLNALIYEGNPTIEELEIIEPNLPPKVEGLKDTYLDVKAKLNDGTLVIIEMQVLNVQSFGKRVLYNAAKTYAFQLPAREGDRMLKPVIALTITDFEMFANSANLNSRFVYKEVNTNLRYPEIARQLISQLDNAMISQVTGRFVEELQNLREAKLSRTRVPSVKGRESGDS